MANRKNAPIKAPNPFGEVELRRGETQPLTPAEPPPGAQFTPLMHTVVNGQQREEPRRAYGHVLTEYGWTKEQETDG